MDCRWLVSLALNVHCIAVMLEHKTTTKIHAVWRTLEKQAFQRMERTRQQSIDENFKNDT